jgi:hypothetical protein
MNFKIYNLDKLMIFKNLTMKFEKIKIINLTSMNLKTWDNN